MWRGGRAPRRSHRHRGANRYRPAGRSIVRSRGEGGADTYFVKSQNSLRRVSVPESGSEISGTANTQIALNVPTGTPEPTTSAGTRSHVPTGGADFSGTPGHATGGSRTLHTYRQAAYSTAKVANGDTNPAAQSVHQHEGAPNPAYKQSLRVGESSRAIKKPAILQRSSSSRSRVRLPRSRNLHLDGRRTQPCLYYSKLGKCLRAGSSEDPCPFRHDPSTISICRSWLVGRCPRSDGECLLEHSIDKNKMPVCDRYMRGVCARGELCIFLHVSHGRDSTVCEAFAIKGFCAAGATCSSVHTWDCLEFSRHGKCPRADSCRMRHWSTARRERAQCVTRSPDGLGVLWPDEDVARANPDVRFDDLIGDGIEDPSGNCVEPSALDGADQGETESTTSRGQITEEGLGRNEGARSDESASS